MNNSPPHPPPPQRRVIRQRGSDRDRNSGLMLGTSKRRKTTNNSKRRISGSSSREAAASEDTSGASSRRTSDASGYYDYSNDDDDDDDDFRRQISSNIIPRKISRESSDAESGNSKSNANSNTVDIRGDPDQSSAAAPFSQTKDGHLQRDYDFVGVPTFLTQHRGQQQMTTTTTTTTIPAAITPVKNVIDDDTPLVNNAVAHHSPNTYMDDDCNYNPYINNHKIINERDRRHSMESFMSIASDLTESEWEQQQQQKRHERTRRGGGGGHRMETGPLARRRNIRPPSSPYNKNSDSGGGGGGILRPPSPFRDGASSSAAASPSSPAARVIADGIDAIDCGRTLGVSVERQISTPPSLDANITLPILLTDTTTPVYTSQIAPVSVGTTTVSHARTVRRHNRSATMLGDMYAMNAIESLQMDDNDDDYDDEEHNVNVPVSRLRRQYKPQQRQQQQQQQQQERRSQTQHYQQPNPPTTKRKGGGGSGGGSKQNMKRNNLVIQLPTPHMEQHGFGGQQYKHQQKQQRQCKQQKLSSRLPPTHPLSNSLSPHSGAYQYKSKHPYHGYSNSTGSIMSETSSAAESEVTPRISQVGRGRGVAGQGWIGEGGGGSGGNEGGWVERYQQNRTRASLTFSFSEDDDDDDDNYGIEVKIDDDKSDSVGDNMMDEGPVVVMTLAKEKKQSQKFTSKRPRPIPIQIPFNELKGIDISFSRKDERDAAARMTSSEYQTRTRTSSDKDHPLLDYKVNDLSPIKAEIYTNEDDYSDNDDDDEEGDHEGNHTRQFSSDDRFFEGIHDSGLQSLSFEQVADVDLKTYKDVEIELVYNSSSSFGCHETDDEESNRNSDGINAEKANLKRILQWRKGRHAWMMGRQQEKSSEKNHEMEGTCEYDDLELTQFTSLPATSRGKIGNHNSSAFAVCSDGRPKSSRQINFGHDNCYDDDDGSEVRSLTSSAGASTPKSLRFPDSADMYRRYGLRKLSSPRILLSICCLVLTAGILMNINFEEHNNQSYAAEENGLWQEEDQGQLTFPDKRSKNFNDDDNGGDDYFESSAVTSLVIDDEDSYEVVDDSVIVKTIASVVSSKSDVQPARDFNKFVGIDTISVVGVCERHPSIDWLVNRLKKLYPDMAVINKLPTDKGVTTSKVKGHILVIAVSVNPYAWVELMRVDSQHDSIYPLPGNDNNGGNLGWEDYVKEILPSINGTILDLRANSIYSAVVESGQHDGVRAVIPLQFEDLVEPYSNYDNFVSDESLSLPGIVGLMDQIQAQTGLHVDESSGWHVAVKDENDFWGDPIECTGHVCFPSVNKMTEDMHFIRYMNEHVDWSMEELIGYYPRHEPKD